MGLRRQAQLTDRARRWASLTLMGASGFAGLGYEIVWTQQGATWLGHEAAAVLAVVAAFFGGVAVGAIALGHRVAKSPRPARWYAACELAIALWGVVLVFAMPPFGAWALRATGVAASPLRQWAISFFGMFVLLLPATAAMGATLPAMDRLAARLGRENGSIAALYAANTAGAVAGVLAAAFFLVPTLGLARTAGACVVLNVLCAAGALALPRDANDQDAAAPVSSAHRPSARLWAQLAASGLLGIGYEVLVVRVLAQVNEDTVYTFALLLAVYLVGTAAGAAAYSRWRARRTTDLDSDLLFAALAVTCLAGTGALWAAGSVRAAASQLLDGAAGPIAAEALVAAIVFGPATLVMGALFSHLGDRARASGVGLGAALGANTLGAAAAPALWGVLAVPAIGTKLALALVALGYLAATSPAAWRRAFVWLPAAGALGLAVLAPPLAFVDVPPGGRVVSYREGVVAAVSVVEDADGVATLRIDNRQQEGSSATFRVDARQAWLPLLLHPAPRRALFLGLGTGVTATAAADDPALRVQAVELLPEVIDAATHFARAPNRLEITAADARRFVRTTDARYDVIVSDNFHPARSGSGALYTIEHFEAVRLRLEAGGLFCQWLPLHQLDLDTVRSIVRSFQAAFPRASALLASNSIETPVLGLVGRADDGRFDVAALRGRAIPAREAELDLGDELTVLGSFVAGPEALARFAAGAPANTDDRPVVAYRAPFVTYAPTSAPRDRLLALVRMMAIDPSAIVSAPDPAFKHRLAAYWAARDRFLEASRDVTPSSRVQDMLAQVREPLLSVLRLSPEFRPAYDPLLMMAASLARSDAALARSLLAELTRLQPARPEAPQLLAQLAGR
jgi:spermidine synthase